MRVFTGAFVMAVAVFMALPRLLLGAQSLAPETPTVWSGVYSDAQAARGADGYATHCANCHRDDLSGYQSLLKGDRFMNEYREASLFRLFDKIKTTMPRNAAGSLSDETYVDILSYVLQANALPAGREDLHLQDLPRILVVRQGGAEPVPDFSLVQVIGCLTRDEADNTWLVTNATEPVRANQPRPTPEELARSAGQRLGAGTFQLLLSAAYVPDPHRGHTVEARGFLIRRAAGHRINVTSLETLSSDCAR